VRPHLPKRQPYDLSDFHRRLPSSGPLVLTLADRTGLGALLLGFQSTAAHNMPFVTKVMLTCFRSNARALAFYRKHGFEADDISPGPRILRGKMYQPDYAILSKPSKPTE